MTTPLFLTGFEHGSTSATGRGIFSNVARSGSSVSMDPVINHSGAYSLKLAKSAGVPAQANIWMAGTSSPHQVMRFYLRFPSLPTAMNRSIYTASVVGIYGGSFTYDVATGRFKLQWWNSSTDLVAAGTARPAIDGSGSPMTVSSNTWYRIDMYFNFSTNPHTADWQINGIPQTRATSPAEFGTTIAQENFFGSSGTDVFTANLDDVLVTTTPADYPLSAGRTAAATVDGNGTSNPGAGAFLTDGGAAWNAGANDSYQRLDDLPGSLGTDYVTQTATSLSAYLEYQLADRTESCVYGVRAVVGYESAVAGGSNTGGTQVRDGTTDRVVQAGNMTVGATRTFEAAMIPPLGTRWTTAEFDGLTLRLGYALLLGGSPPPAPQWHNLLVEYATE